VEAEVSADDQRFGPAPRRDAAREASAANSPALGERPWRNLGVGRGRAARIMRGSQAAVSRVSRASRHIGERAGIGRDIASGTARPGRSGEKVSACSAVCGSGGRLGMRRMLWIHTTDRGAAADIADQGRAMPGPAIQSQTRAGRRAVFGVGAATLAGCCRPRRSSDNGPRSALTGRQQIGELAFGQEIRPDHEPVVPEPGASPYRAHQRRDARPHRRDPVAPADRRRCSPCSLSQRLRSPGCAREGLSRSELRRP